MDPDYDVFLSYSHRADAILTGHVRRAIETFTAPFFRGRSIRVFQDDASLPMTDDLWAAIATRLSHSRFLVVIASPEAAASAWVSREILHFVGGSPDAEARVLFVLAGGHLPWDPRPGGAIALPEAVIERLEGRGRVPLHVDLREWRRATRWQVWRSSRFQAGIAALVACLLGRNKDDIWGEHLRRQRLRAVLAALTSATLVALAFGVVTASSLARKEADRRRRAAELTAAIASREADPGGALDRLANLRHDPPDGWEQAVLDTLTGGVPVAVVPGRGLKLQRACWSGVERTFVAVSAGPTLHRWELAPGAEAPAAVTLSSAPLPAEVMTWACASDGSLVGTAGDDGIWRVLPDSAASLDIGEDCSVRSADARGDLLALGCSDGTVLLRLGDEERRLGTAVPWPTPPDDLGNMGMSLAAIAYRGTVDAIALSPDRRWLAWANLDDGVRLYDLQRDAEVKLPSAQTSEYDTVNALAFGPDSARLMAASAGALTFWRRLEDPLVEHAASTKAERITSAAFTHDGAYELAGTSGGAVEVFWDASKRPTRVLRGPRGKIMALGADKESRTVMALVEDGELWMWRDELSGLPATRGLPVPYDASSLPLSLLIEGERATVWMSSGEAWSAPLDGGRPVSQGRIPERVSKIAVGPQHRYIVLDRSKPWKGQEILREPRHVLAAQLGGASSPLVPLTDELAEDVRDLAADPDPTRHRVAMLTSTRVVVMSPEGKILRERKVENSLRTSWLRDRLVLAPRGGAAPYLWNPDTDATQELGGAFVDDFRTVCLSPGANGLALVSGRALTWYDPDGVPRIGPVTAAASRILGCTFDRAGHLLALWESGGAQIRVWRDAAPWRNIEPLSSDDAFAASFDAAGDNLLFAGHEGQLLRAPLTAQAVDRWLEEWRPRPPTR